MLPNRASLLCLWLIPTNKNIVKQQTATHVSNYIRIYTILRGVMDMMFIIIIYIMYIMPIIEAVYWSSTHRFRLLSEYVICSSSTMRECIFLACFSLIFLLWRYNPSCKPPSSIRCEALSSNFSCSLSESAKFISRAVNLFRMCFIANPYLRLLKKR